MKVETRWRDLFSGKNAAGSTVLMGGVTLHAINVYISTTILPSIVEDIGGLNLYAWNTTLFVVASILASATSAHLLTRFGARSSYSIACLLFASGSAICALAPNMETMLAGRLIQGAGGGFLFALSYSMIHLIFEQPLWPRAMTLISIMWGVATLIGPAIGGIFAELHIWRGAFISLLPIIGLFLFIAYRVLPVQLNKTDLSLALPLHQLVLLALSVLAISAASVSHTVIGNIIGIGLALLFIILLIYSERSPKTHLLPRDAFKIFSPIGALYATMSLMMLAINSEIFIPYFLQTLHHLSPLSAGYLTALIAIGWTLSALLSAGWQEIGSRWAIRLGPLIIAVGSLILAILLPKESQSEWLLLVPICLALIMLGFGIGIGWSHILTRVLKTVDGDQQNIAASSITTTQLFATALGASCAGVVANLAGISQPDGISGASNAAYWLFILFALPAILAGVMAFISTRR